MKYLPIKKRHALKVWIVVACFASHSIAFGSIKIGWASSNTTPTQPTLISGQFYARYSEGVVDSLYATALALESDGKSIGKRIVMVSCDLVGIPDYLRDRVRELVVKAVPILNMDDILLNATHTHTAPVMSQTESNEFYGIPYQWFTRGKTSMTPKEYFEFAVQKISEAAIQAWESRSEGGISYGLSKAVVGHNRLQVDRNGKSLMYGNTSRPEFSHIEGYEDHNLNLLYTWDRSGKLTGIVINAAVPAQVSGQLYEISADFWTEARTLLRKEIGKDLFILSQVSAAGDQSPYTMWGGPAEERMQRLMGFEKDGIGRNTIGRRKVIARHITDGVKAILPYMKKNIEWEPIFSKKVEIVPLPRRSLGTFNAEFVENLRKEMEENKTEYENMLADVTNTPRKREGNRWYKDITTANSLYERARRVYDRYKSADITDPMVQVEFAAIRIGDMVFVTNPFELYLDYGIQIKVKSPAVQTFIVQLAGGGTYLPTQRSIDGGAYGAVPASTTVGPDGGYELVDKTVELIHSLWNRGE